MATRIFSAASAVSSENEAVSGKEMANAYARRFEVKARPPLASVNTRIDKLSTTSVQNPFQLLLNKNETKPNDKGEPAVASVKPMTKTSGPKVGSTNEQPTPVPMDFSTVDNLAVAFSNLMLNVQDIDAGDETNPFLVSCYVNDIYSYLFKLECSYPVRWNYLDKRLITGRMRSVLVDWLVQVSVRFDLLPETIYMAVKIFDRYLQNQIVSKDKLQLVGVTALFIACKYEEMYSPSIQDFSYITDKTYATSEIRKMEVTILKELQFMLGCPLPIQFLRRNSKAGNVDITTHTLAKYLCELSLVEYSFVHYKPSQIASAALYLALTLLKDTTWTRTLEHYSRYTEQELKPIAKQLASVVLKLDSSKYQAVRSKYASSKFSRISGITQLKGDSIKAFCQ